MNTPSVDPSGRVQVIANPIASPGQCGICGKAEHPRGFIDIRMDFEFYGTLYFCYDCTGDMARAVGFLSAEDLVGIRQQVNEQNNELITLRAAILGLESAVDGLTNYRDLRGNSTRGDNGSAGDSPGADPDQGSPGDAGQPESRPRPPEGPPVPRAATNRHPNQSRDESGPDDLLGPTESDALLGLD